MLILGSDLMAQSFDAQYRSAALSASRKIENVLPEKLRDEVHYLQDSIRFITTNAMEQPIETEKLLQIRRAILQRNTISFHYFTRHPSATAETEEDQSVPTNHPTSFAPAQSTRQEKKLLMDCLSFLNRIKRAKCYNGCSVGEDMSRY